MKGSLEDHLRVEVGIVSDDQAIGTVNGTGIDKTAFEEALIIVNSGVNAATGTADVKVQDSADNSAWADITGAVFVQITTANDVTVYAGRLDLQATRKFIRVVSVVATAACNIGVVVVLGQAQVRAPSQVNALAFSL